ncbi:MAG: Ig-like domain-containing protein, partial [Clostridia bacterium]|nr:Ig-like domain-containing protein [Clostridia bacterium]
MKKVLIAILLLVPLVVVLTINVSSTIISAEIKIELTTLKLTDKDGNVMTYVPVNLDDDNVFLLYASYFPKNASNKDLDWVSSDPKVATVKKRGNYAEITFDYDSYDKAVEISATSRSNGAVRAATTFYVTGDTPNRIEFSDWDGEPISQVNLAVYDRVAVKGNVVPAASKGDAKLSWWVSDETVATVDGNGIVKGLKKGACELFCQIGEGKKAVSASIPVVVNGVSLSNSDVYYTTGSTYNLAQNGDLPEGVTASANGQAV